MQCMASVPFNAGFLEMATSRLNHFMAAGLPPDLYVASLKSLRAEYPDLDPRDPTPCPIPLVACKGAFTAKSEQGRHLESIACS